MAYIENVRRDKNKITQARNGRKGTKMKGYIVEAIWYGLYDEPYTEWYSGTIHETRSDARIELIEAQKDRNFDSFRIVTVDR